MCRDLNWEACCFRDKDDEMAGAFGMGRVKERLIQEFEQESFRVRRLLRLRRSVQLFRFLTTLSLH
jgi:hypothetical protein